MSNDDSKPPCLAERYQSATTSSHLRLEAGRCDLDYMIAAGFLKDGLGALLYRLRGEFDATKAAIRTTHGEEWTEALQQAEHAIRAAGDEVNAVQLAEPNRIRREIQAAMITERYETLARLKTLEQAREALGNFAVILATKVRFMQNDAAVARLTGKVLDAWLDPICDGCQGRGFNGGSHRGERKMTCSQCRGTTKRKESLGRDDEERRFIGALFVEIESHQESVSQELRRYLEQRELPAAGLNGSAAQDMQARLADLRSAEAAID